MNQKDKRTMNKPMSDPMSDPTFARIAEQADADRARFGTPETLVAEFERNATEKVIVERSGQLVRISTRSKTAGAHARAYDATGFECTIEHVAPLIQGLINAL